ncbi:multidrug transporter AcrB, partial [Planctomycetaceae bacterium SCGC AG-212-F19]
MLDAVIRWSLRYRSLVMVLALAALLYGGYLATTMPIDVFPDLDRPRVVILTECPGLSPEEVETLVTHPIESRLLGAAGVQAVRSQSSIGLTVIYVEFDWSTEIRTARQVVQERLATLAGVLPEGVRPQMTPPSSIMGQIMHVGLYRRQGPQGGDLFPVGTTGLLAERVANDAALTVWRPKDRSNPATWEPVPTERVLWDAPPSRDEGRERRVQVVIKGQTHEVIVRTPQQQQMDLRTTADWVIRPRLLQVPGIAEVLVMGGDRKQYQVLVDPHALLEYDVTLQQVEQAVRDNNLNASGGFTVEGQKERPIRVIGRLGPLPAKVADDLRKVPIKSHAHRNILLSQVARIVEGPEPKRGDGSISGSPGVVITVVKQPHTDTRGLTDNIKATLRTAADALPADYVINTDLFQLRGFIDRGIYYVGEALVLGAGLVILILFLFLLNFRTTFITLTAIPLSLAVTALVFRLIGFFTGHALSINVMTLGGIAVAMGELVDDAIVDVENIYRRLRENNALPQPRPALRVVYEASKEIRSAIVFGTLVVILVFLPLFALSGVEGRLFTPLGIAYIVSILASLLVSLTVTPVLSYYLLPQSKAAHRTTESHLLRGLKWAAGYLIRFSMRHASALLLVTWALAGLTVWQLTRLGSDFLPPFDEGSVQINVSLPPGASLHASNEDAAVIDARLRQMQRTDANPAGAILDFVRRTGRAELDEHAEPVSRSEYILSMNPRAGRSREEMLRQLLDGLKEELPGVEFEAEQPLAHLISHMLSGVNAQVAIKIYGDDLDVLGQLARQVKAQISDVPGVTTPIVEPQVHLDELHIVLRPDDLAFFGVSRAFVAEFVRTALHGEAVSQVLDGQRRFDLVVKLQEPYRTDYDRLRELRIDLPEARGQIKLGDVADFPDSAAGPNQLMRENVRRRTVVRCNVLGRDLGSTVAEIQQRIRQAVALPNGYSVEYGGQFESQRSATLLIGVLAGVAIVGMFVVLLILQPSVRIVLQILNAIPTAFIGGVLALVLTGQTLTVASLVGFVSLGGIAVRNGILLVTHYFHLMDEEGAPFTEAMVLRGSLERLAPVLMTALTAGIGLVPLVLGGRKPGLEILYPVATVILGGLVTSTFCEFLIHPGLFWRFSG